MTSAYPAGGNNKPVALFNQATDSRKINTHRRSHRIDTAQCTVWARVCVCVCVCVWFYVGSHYRPTPGLGDRTRGEHCYHFTSSTLEWPTFRSPIKNKTNKTNKQNTLYGRNYILNSNTINQHNLLWGEKPNEEAGIRYVIVHVLDSIVWSWS